jgi:hypothetical protein
LRLTYKMGKKINELTTICEVRVINYIWISTKTKHKFNSGHPNLELLQMFFDLKWDGLQGHESCPM